MRWLLVMLCIFVLILQYRLWVGDGSLAHKYELQKDVIAQQKKNDALKKKNQALADEVKNLTDNIETVEERARRDLGMIKDGETFYMVIETEN